MNTILDMKVEIQMNDQWIARTNDYKQENLSGEVLTCQKSELTTQALKKLGTYWGVALLCILIPVLHFVLVPTFFILGVFLSYKTMGYQFRLKECSFQCPQCSAKNEIKNLWFGADLRMNCRNCGTQIVVMRTPQTAP